MSISAEAVVWCYRLILGREPESDAVIAAYTQTADLGTLRQIFLDSEEFQKSTAARQILSSLRRFESQPMRVDVEVTPTQLAELLRRIRACWQALGESQPHWSVMSDEQFRPGNIESSIQLFWNSGRRPVKDLEAILGRIGFGSLSDKVCVDYGCGVARVTTHLAPLFAQVHGYDVSASHLARARERMIECGIGNLELHLAAEDPLAPITPCDVFYSRLVLQHNPPPLIRQLLLVALQALRPGGVAVFQLATYAATYRFDVDAYLAQSPESVSEFEIHCFPQAEVFRLVAAQGCQVLEVHEDGAAGQPESCVSSLFVVRKGR